MPSLKSSFWRVGRLLAHHVRRLNTALERLTAEVRTAVARAIGQATGDVVREAIHVILDGPPGRPQSYDPPEEREGRWGQPSRRSWPGQAYDADSRDPYYRDLDDDPEDEVRGYDASAEESPQAEPGRMARRGVWSRAVAAGCQAAAWWLRRHPGPFALVTAAGVGVAAGVAALVGGPFLNAGSVVAASALSLLALADAARSASTLAADALN